MPDELDHRIWYAQTALTDLKALLVSSRPSPEQMADLTKLRALFEEVFPPAMPQEGQQITSGLPKTKLYMAVRALCADIALCSGERDTNMLEALLASHKNIIDQCKRDLPGWWFSNAERDVVGLEERIAEARKVCLQPA